MYSQVVPCKALKAHRKKQFPYRNMKMLSPEEARYLFHHVFLPPKTPQKDDFRPDVGHLFVDEVHLALLRFESIASNHAGVSLAPVSQMINTMRAVHDHATHDLIEGEVLKAIKGLMSQGGFIPLFVRAQNAAVIIRKTSDQVYFELFEVSPRNEAAMSTMGRLIRHFPASVVEIRDDVAGDGDFQAQVAKTLAQMSHQAIPGQRPKVKKAGSLHDESRDTTHPGMVTDFFEGILSGLGRIVDSDSVVKHTREEICWSDAKFPWRRSPMWLLVRVSLQLSFSRSASSPLDGCLVYKKFMVFLMTQIVQRLPRAQVASELLYSMHAKISRRLNKLPEIDRDLSAEVFEVVGKSHKDVAERWTVRQAADKRELGLASLRTLNLEQDCVLHLPDLKTFVFAVLDDGGKQSRPEFLPESSLTVFTDQTLPNIHCGDELGSALEGLHAFEAWVAANLSQWQRQNSTLDACAQLGQLFQKYHHRAAREYNGNPETISKMILVSLELWVACDQIAGAMEPLLGEYDPGVPRDLLQNLLLPFREQMIRLHEVEIYLRHRAGSPLPTSLLYDIHDANSFSARYFDRSAEHQQLRDEIERWAAQTKERKIEEWKVLRAKYESLMQRHELAACDYYEEVVYRYGTSWTESRHSSSCQKCQYRTEASDLQITVHEWPLPKDPVELKTVVFELLVPRWYGLWRDTLVYLRHGVLALAYDKVTKPRSTHHLSQDPHLANKFFNGYQGRIGLLSQTKPHVGTHRNGRELSISAEDDICLSTGLRYLYFDRSADCFVVASHGTETIPQACTYQLPSQSNALQRFIWRPAANPQGPSPNTVIASQADCPDHFSLGEYKDLCSIPLGIDLQWWDIAAHLTAPTINFQKVETLLVILQCIYQTGPDSEEAPTLRCGHRLIGDMHFCEVLLHGLQEALQRIRENWECLQNLEVFVAVARRLLSLTSSEDIRDGCMTYLIATRETAMRWVMELQLKRQAAQRQADRNEFQERLVQAALVCASSFDVDARFQAQTLAHSDMASILLQCSIIIHNGHHGLDCPRADRTAFLRLRLQRLLYDVHALLAENQGALDDAVQATCVSYRPGRGWQLVPGTTHWVVSPFLPIGSQVDSKVHLDLLTGDILVDGSPLDRLPQHYEKHPSYRDLFGLSTIEVVPTSSPGTEFASKDRYRGYELEFGMCRTTQASSPDMVVRAIIDSTTYMLLPSRIFLGIVPDSLVNGFFHWYDHSRDVVEFRPRAHPWARDSPEQWILQIGDDDSEWRLLRAKDQAVLIGLKTETAQMLSHVFSPLAQPSRLHTLFVPTAAYVEIKLPDLNLCFSLSKRSMQLKSREFRDFLVDEDQSLGTLVGFCNKMVLRDGCRSRRMVLAVEGRVSLSHELEKPGHQAAQEAISVSVDLMQVSRIHAFSVEPRLGRLTGNGSLESRLWLTYLHALTSFCLPDPLTGKTGTEQALFILKSAAVRSFAQLTHQNVDHLKLIAGLTPKRAFYPDHEHVMQTITWSPVLGFLAQHASFYKSVTSILSQAERSQIFDPDAIVQIPMLSDVEPSLLERDCVRSSSFRVSGFGAEDFRSDLDVIYSSREKSQRRGSTTHVISTLIAGRAQSLHWTAPSADNMWELLSKSKSVNGPAHNLVDGWPRYDAAYVKEGVSFVSQNWPSLHRILSDKKFPGLNKFSVIMWLSAISCSNIDKKILGILAWFYSTPALATEYAPNKRVFQMQHGKDAQRFLPQILSANSRDFHASPESRLSRQQHETGKSFGRRVQGLFRGNQARAINLLTSELQRQWPCPRPRLPEDSGPERIYSYVDKDRVTASLNERFASCFRNLRLYDYVSGVIALARKSPVIGVSPSTRLFSLVSFIPTTVRFLEGERLFDSQAPYFGRSTVDRSFSPYEEQAQTFPRLRTFISEMKARVGQSPHEGEYLDKVKHSLTALEQQSRTTTWRVPSLQTLRRQMTHHRDKVKRMEKNLMEVITHGSGSDGHPFALSEMVGQGPRVGLEFLLRRLSRTLWSTLNDSWKESIVSFGLELTALQRAERLVDASVAGKTASLVREWENPGHSNWDPLDHPESLLLEVETGIMIRDVQEETASQMREPLSGQNSSMQLNMGEGKSSVIVPIVAAHLADGSRLVRVIVAKPQSRQMAQMLIAKLGGLLDRRIYYLPFSRSLRLDNSKARLIDEMCRECMNDGGVLLVQPEHLLSFQLMVLERPIGGDLAVGSALLKTYRFFEEKSRDIIDESDENFNVRFELIYTMGSQRQLEFCPDRWVCIREILALVREIGPEVALALPMSMQIENILPGSFPLTRVLTPDAATMLVSRIARRICETGLPGCPVSRQSPATVEAVFTYITKWDLSEAEVMSVEDDGPHGFWTETVRSKLLMLRGLLAGGTLAFVLHRKRWCVNYGLDSMRRPATRLAVPYRAKDQPSLRSDFSHPDVTILLTYLSYYYGNLEDDDVYLAFEQLLESDSKDVEYQEWVKDLPSLPPAFRHLQGVNLKDRPNCTSILFPELRKAKNVADFFLAHVVFPKELRVFPHKLCASGWDIGRTKTHPTTAFSGTCDSYPLLPLDVKQLDLPQQLHTNALVLDYLLRPENSVVMIPPKLTAQGSDAEWILATVMDEKLNESSRPPRMILDVGAQILNLSNQEVARVWLQQHQPDSAEAVVFFDDRDELTVLNREGNVECLQTSPFATRLDVCLIFLDEAHTRGTDLVLPTDYRAAVTLGPGLTKDRLVQACMRLRQLGKGQTVVFIISEEIQTKIRDSVSKPLQSAITVSDVLYWTILETLEDIRRSILLWAKQGRNFHRQRMLWAACSGSIDAHHASLFLEDEARTLESRYRPASASVAALEVSKLPPSDAYLSLIDERCRLANLPLGFPDTLEEEQEKELAPEMQEERQIERPPFAAPATHILHPDVVRFAEEGTLLAETDAYQPAFSSLRNLTAARDFDVDQLVNDRQVLVTRDFVNTVKTTGAHVSDPYLRSVQWVLTLAQCNIPCRTKPALVISPFEAQGLMSRLRKGSAAVLHIYKSRWNILYPPLNRLDFFSYPTSTLPRLPLQMSMAELDLFAGRTDFSAFEEYVQTCMFLGLASSAVDTELTPDGFILDSRADSRVSSSLLKKSPVVFIKALTSIRVNHREFAATNMGKLLSGVQLKESDIREG